MSVLGPNRGPSTDAIGQQFGSPSAAAGRELDPAEPDELPVMPVFALPPVVPLVPAPWLAMLPLLPVVDPLAPVLLPDRVVVISRIWLAALSQHLPWLMEEVEGVVEVCAPATPIPPASIAATATIAIRVI